MGPYVGSNTPELLISPRSGHKTGEYAEASCGPEKLNSTINHLYSPRLLEPETETRKPEPQTPRPSKHKESRCIFRAEAPEGRGGVAAWHLRLPVRDIAGCVQVLGRLGTLGTLGFRDFRDFRDFRGLGFRDLRDFRVWGPR